MRPDISCYTRYHRIYYNIYNDYKVPFHVENLTDYVLLNILDITIDLVKCKAFYLNFI